MEGFLGYRFGGLIFGGAYTWRGLFSEFYGIRGLTKLQRRQQRECQKVSGFNEKNNNSVHASRFFVHFIAVPAQLQHEMTKY